jgi:hypothetical protein
MLVMTKPGSLRWKLAAWILRIPADQMVVKTRFEEDSHQWQIQTFKDSNYRYIRLLCEAEKQGFNTLRIRT